MSGQPYNVLFVCTGNSARSILAEALVNHWGAGRFRGHSAGSFPKGQVHPFALDLLRSLGIPTEGMRSKSWDEFARADAPRMDFVITVCDQAAGETCPIWPGQPVTGHWGVFDPATIDGPEHVRRQAFRDAFHVLESRIRIFTSLRPDSLDHLSLKRRVAEIAQVGTEQPQAGAASAA